MKKGKQNHSNIIAVTALSLLCVGILGGAFLLNRSPEPVFEPAASEPAAETVTWSEPETKPAAASLPKETEAPTRELLEGTPDDEIQVVESEGDEVEIALTPPVTKPAREIPETQSQPAKAARINQRRLQQKRLRIRKDRKLQLLQPIQTSMKVRFMTLSSAGRPQVLPRQISWITMGM